MNSDPRISSQILLASAVQVRWFRQRLLKWGRANFRDFPWRSESNLYRILITEVLLKQTDAAKVIPVRDEFFNKYPTCHELANASLRHLNVLLRPIGLNNQRAIQLLALGVALRNSSTTLTSKDDLQGLPGIGPYASAATACFAFGAPEPALDVNMARIVSRIFGITPARGELRRNRIIRQLAKQLISVRSARNLNWALLDLGALVCRPKPMCEACPLEGRCKYALAKRT